MAHFLLRRFFALKKQLSKIPLESLASGGFELLQLLLRSLAMTACLLSVLFYVEFSAASK